MGVAEITAGAAVLQALIKAWDRWKERRHERWKMRLERERQRLIEKEQTIDDKITRIDVALQKDELHNMRENQSC